ncbi:hypothetical protein NC653_028572 [Populus alba x Populus x berolinensis]|uniref:Uncharacterized protein n=1 Tax=Populus alba x Populus x berolinensis TaxID=444605 RepID=A0AAD6Q2F8_9ROSI|nr:hypothetical protein NC653_028572 [Populus alba x Populus x berolinensis]
MSTLHGTVSVGNTAVLISKIDVFSAIHALIRTSFVARLMAAVLGDIYPSIIPCSRLMGTVRCWGLLPLVLVFYKIPCQQKTIMTKQRCWKHGNIN